jgi:hypothetical protein
MTGVGRGTGAKTGDAPPKMGFNTPLGPMSRTYPPPTDPRAHGVPDWLADLLERDNNPELTEIAKILARRGIYHDPRKSREKPTIADRKSKGPQMREIDFRERFIVTTVQGAQYSVLRAVGGEIAPSSDDTSLDGVYDKSDERGTRITQRLGAAIDASNSVLQGQFDAHTRLSSFRFIYDENTGSWTIIDVSTPSKPYPLPETQAKEILKGIFESYGRKSPEFGS